MFKTEKSWLKLTMAGAISKTSRDQSISKNLTMKDSVKELVPLNSQNTCRIM